MLSQNLKLCISYLSSIWFFLNCMREKFECQARLSGYQGNGLIASASPPSATWGIQLVQKAISFEHMNSGRTNMCTHIFFCQICKCLTSACRDFMKSFSNWDRMSAQNWVLQDSQHIIIIKVNYKVLFGYIILWKLKLCHFHMSNDIKSRPFSIRQ